LAAGHAFEARWEAELLARRPDPSALGGRLP
jgi:hypothetical protein